MDGQVLIQYQGIVHSVTPLSQHSSSEALSVWMYRMEMILEEHDCWKAVSQEHCLLWDEQDKTARLLIAKAVSDDMVLLIKDKTAKQMWDTLVDSFKKDEQPTRVKVETGKGTQNDSQTDTGFEAFMAAETREEMIREVDKLAEKVKSLPSAADEIGSNEAVMRKVKDKLDESHEKDQLMFEKIAKLLESITSNLKEGSTARNIAQILGFSLIMGSKALAPGTGKLLLQVVANLCLHGPAVLLLEPLGIVQLFLSGILNPWTFMIAVVGLGLCMKHLPALLRNEEFQENVKKVAEFCTNVLKNSWNYTCKVVDFAREMIQKLIDFCIEKITEGYNYLREKALEVLYAITAHFEGYEGDVFSYVREKIKIALFTFFKYISDFGQSISKESLTGVLSIVRFVGDEDVRTFVKNNTKLLCKKSLEAVCQTSTEGYRALHDLLSWFKENVLKNLLMALIVGGMALLAPMPLALKNTA